MSKRLCPNCGASVETNPYADTICPFCKSVIPAQQKGRTIDITPDLIIPLNIDDKEFMTDFVQALVNYELAPRDVFQGIKVSKIHKFLVPMYYVQGMYSAPWNCNVGFRQKRQRYNKREGKIEDYEETVWHPASGEARGTYDYLIAASDAKPMTERLRDFVGETLEFLCNPFEPFDPSLVNPDEKIVEINMQPQQGWSYSNAHTKLMLSARYNAESQVQADDISNFNCTPSYQHQNCQLTLVSMWYVTFKYRKDTYHYIKTGFKYDLDAPHGIEIERDIKIRELESKKGYGGWLLGGLASIILAILCVCIWHNYTDTNPISFAFFLIVLPILLLIIGFCYNSSLDEQIEKRTAEIKADTRTKRLRAARAVFKGKINKIR